LVFSVLPLCCVTLNESSPHSGPSSLVCRRQAWRIALIKTYFLLPAASSQLPPSSHQLYSGFCSVLGNLVHHLEHCVCFSLPRNSGYKGTAEVKHLPASKPFLTPEIKTPFPVCQAQGDLVSTTRAGCLLPTQPAWTHGSFP
ncbi:mCG144845, partial [Mus musculus]